MSTIAPLPDCPVCRGSGKTSEGFCPCLARPNDSVDILLYGLLDAPPLTASEAPKSGEKEKMNRHIESLIEAELKNRIYIMDREHRGLKVGDISAEEFKDYVDDV